jgi:hypothetical protein
MAEDLRVVGSVRDRDQADHVRDCMRSVLIQVQSVAGKSFATCTTEGQIHSSQYGDQDSHTDEYVLPVLVDCNCFCVKMSIQYIIIYSTVDGYYVSFNVILENIIIKKADTLNKEYYKGLPGIPFRDQDTVSVQLYPSRAAPQEQRDSDKDFNIITQVSWAVLCKLRRLFIINALDRYPTYRLQNPNIYGDLVHWVHEGVDEIIFSLHYYATSSWPSAPPQPY